MTSLGNLSVSIRPKCQMEIDPIYERRYKALMINKFDYPVLQRVTNPDGTRFYTCPDTNEQLASVTTILSNTADKTFLVEWRKRIGDQEADRQSNYGSGLGSLVHENIENHILGIDRPKGNAPMRTLSRKMADQIITKCLPSVSEIWGIEVPLFYPGLYAGTTDLIGLHEGKQAIIDHKNAKKMRKRSDISDYFHQLAAYAIAHDARYGTQMDRGVIFMVDRALNCEQFVIDGLDFKKAKDEWLDRVGRYLDSL